MKTDKELDNGLRKSAMSDTVINNSPCGEAEVKAISYEEMPGTPFTIINDGEKYRIAIGNEIVCPTNFETIENAKKYIKSKPWDLLAITSMVMASKIYEIK
jgi:hypothetical protein